MQTKYMLIYISHMLRCREYVYYWLRLLPLRRAGKNASDVATKSNYPHTRRH